MTGKEKLERVKQLKCRKTAAFSAIIKCHINELVNSMTDEHNLHVVKGKLDKNNNFGRKVRNWVYGAE